MSIRCSPRSSRTKTSVATSSNPEVSGNGNRPSRCDVARVSSVLWLTLLLTACGKVGDPLPPIPKAPLIVNELTATQRGTQIALSFPLTRTARSPRLGQISIYRLIEPPGAPLGLPQDAFEAQSTIIYQMPGGALSQGTSVVTYEDQIAPTTLPESRFRYAVRLVSPAGVAADFSNYAVITPIIDIPKPPSNVKAVVTQDEITLTWTVPSRNEIGDGTPNVAGYNIYRRSSGALTKLNAQPLSENTYADRSFSFGTRYEYVLRSLSVPAGASTTAAIESNDSEIAAVMPKDIFPPAAPDSIKIASINGVVSMFWPANAEPDLAGYLIYRSEDPNAPLDKWLKLTPRVYTPTTFRDDKVAVGKTYHYQLSAVDRSGNEGRRSAVVSETVNP